MLTRSRRACGDARGTPTLELRESSGTEPLVVPAEAAIAATSTFALVARNIRLVDTEKLTRRGRAVGLIATAHWDGVLNVFVGACTHVEGGEIDGDVGLRVVIEDSIVRTVASDGSLCTIE